MRLCRLIGNPKPDKLRIIRLKLLLHGARIRRQCAVIRPGQGKFKSFAGPAAKPKAVGLIDKGLHTGQCIKRPTDRTGDFLLAAAAFIPRHQGRNHQRTVRVPKTDNRIDVIGIAGLDNRTQDVFNRFDLPVHVINTNPVRPAQRHQNTSAILVGQKFLRDAVINPKGQHTGKDRHDQGNQREPQNPFKNVFVNPRTVKPDPFQKIRLGILVPVMRVNML